MTQSRHPVQGMTLVELLVVIAVLSALLALLLPAVQLCREAARKITCRNNLRQLSLAIQSHESLHGHLPTGGWGWRWTGDPDRGFGPQQPGGWVFNLLPFLEQAQLRKMGTALAFDEKAKLLAESAAIPLPVLVCPSRRSPRPQPYVHRFDYVNASRPSAVARSDYAACSGDFAPDVAAGKGRGPQSLAEGDSHRFHWRDVDLTGAVFRRSTVRLATISDGLSNTYLVGEKYLARVHYVSGTGQNDDQHMLVGFDSDTLRTTDPNFPPLADTRSTASDHAFGSAHASAFHIALADGAVTSISYAVDREIHRARGNRGDGAPAGQP